MATKLDFYKERSKDYLFADPEALLRYRRALAQARTRLPDGRIVVAEIGCKFAAVRGVLDEMEIEHDYTGIDLDAGSLEKIKKRENDNFIVADADRQIPALDRLVDLFLAMEVIEHVESPLRVLKTMASHLSDRGLILISVPNPYYWGEMLHNLSRKPDTEGHISSLTHINIDAICRFAGLKQVVRGGTFNRIPLTRRLLGRQVLVPANSLFTSRSLVFGLQKVQTNGVA